jgi:acyl-homoserine-lactone acylase
MLRAWDHRTSEDSIATAVAIFWGQSLISQNPAAALEFDEPVFLHLVDHTTDNERLDALTAAVATLTKDYGQWYMPWGAINRYQRLNDDIVPSFDDSKPSLPVAMTSSKWGALAAFTPDEPKKNSRIYGVSGNSFIAAIDFGPTVHAKVLTCGGESGDPASPHFVDQAQMYRHGVFRDALLTREDVLAHAARRYHPGESGG